MRLLSITSLVLLTSWLLGCPATFGSGDQAGPPVLERTILGADGTPTGTVRVALDGNVQGRGCQLLDISKEGDVSLYQQMDASSDWSSLRAVVAVLPETVAAIMTVVSGPVDALRDLIGNRPPMQAPSSIHGCEAMFEQSKIDETQQTLE